MKHIAIILLLLFPTVSAAQVRGDKCGTRENPEALLNILSPYFMDDEYADFRDGLIEQVSPDVTPTVVLDEKVCGPIMRDVVKRLRSQTNWRDIQRNGYEFNVLEYGPYYAIVVLEKSLPDTTNLGWSTMFIFRASDLQFLGIGLV